MTIKSQKDYTLGVIGLGYVGLPLVVEFSKFFRVIGFDKNKTRIKALNNQTDVTSEISSKKPWRHIGYYI